MSTCKVKRGECCEKVVAPHSALVAPDLAPDCYPAHTPVTTATPPQPTAPIGTGASDTMSSQNHQEIADLKTVAAASRAEEPWLPAPPPLPHGLRVQFQQAHASLAQKDKSLVEKDQKLKLYGELIAALELENSNLKLLLQEIGDRYQLHEQLQQAQTSLAQNTSSWLRRNRKLYKVIWRTHCDEGAAGSQ